MAEAHHSHALEICGPSRAHKHIYHGYSIRHGCHSHFTVLLQREEKNIVMHCHIKYRFTPILFQYVCTLIQGEKVCMYYTLPGVKFVVCICSGEGTLNRKDQPRALSCLRQTSKWGLHTHTHTHTQRGREGETGVCVIVLKASKLIWAPAAEIKCTNTSPTV